MANNLGANPFIIDTPGAGVLYSRVIDVVLIRWISPGAAAGHQVLIQDQNGVNKWETVAPGANYAEADHIDLLDPWNGLIVPTLSSGRLYIYFH